MSKGRKPPPAIHGCKVEQFAIRTRAIRFHEPTHIYVGDKQLGPVPRFAICRDARGIALFYCDRRWKVLAIVAPGTVREAKQRIERNYPGISQLWEKTGYTTARYKKYLNEIGHNLKCSFCGRFWHQVERMITARRDEVAVCDGCVRHMSERIRDDGK